MGTSSAFEVLQVEVGEFEDWAVLAEILHYRHRFTEFRDVIARRSVLEAEECQLREELRFIQGRLEAA